MKFIVDLWLDGIDDDPDGKAQEEACLTFIQEQLDMTASSVKVEKYNPDRVLIEKEAEINKAFSALELCGIPRERAGNIANGIEVLKTRYHKEIDSLK
jgi:hypothetical protein